MAQRTFPCTACGTNIEVPDDYFKAQIACPACHAPHHRLTGKAAIAGAHAPAARAPIPQAMPPGNPPRGPMQGATPPGYPRRGPTQNGAPMQRPGAAPYPVAYPQAFAHLGPPPKSSNKGLFIGLGIAGGVIVLVLVAIIAAIPLIAGAGTDLDDSSDWYEHTSQAGGYSVKFPAKPVEESKTLANGVRSTETIALKRGLAYIVTYFELPATPRGQRSWNAAKGFASLADTRNAFVTSLEPVTFCGRSAEKAILENSTGYRAELISMDTGDRVYVVGCERVRGSAEINTRPFLDTFKLLGDEKLNHAYGLYKKVGRTWIQRTSVKNLGVDPFVTFTKTEVMKIGDDYAEIRTSLLDKDKQPLGGSSTTTKIEFRMHQGGTAPPTDTNVVTRDETIKVEAGVFECTLTITEMSGMKSMIWMSKKYPGLQIKMVSGPNSEHTTELVEFNE